MKPTKCIICGMPIREGDICYDCEIKEKQRKEQHKRLFGMAFSKDVTTKKNLVDAKPVVINKIKDECSCPYCGEKIIVGGANNE